MLSYRDQLHFAQVRGIIREKGHPMRHQITFVLLLLSLLVGCGDNEQQFQSSEGKPYPYILKEGCTFTITEELSKAGVDSPKVSGAPIMTASATASLGELSITVSDCKVIENASGLPIYEK